MSDRSQGNSTEGPPLFLKIAQGNNEFQGIRTAPSRSGLHKILGTPQNLTGFRYGPEGFEEWHAKGIREYSGYIYLTFSREVLPEKTKLHSFFEVYRHSPAFALRMLRLLFTALEQPAPRTLQTNFAPGAALLSGTFYDDEQNLYLLSPDAAEILYQESDQPYLPSGISGERELSYLVLRNLFLSLWAESGCAESGEDGFPVPKKNEPFSIHPYFAVPGLYQKLAETFYSALAKEDPPKISELVTQLADMETSGFLEDLNPRSKSERLETARKLTRKIEQYRSRVFFKKKYGPGILLAAAVVATILFFASPFIRKAFEKDVTEGLPPEEVISLFYESQNELDHETMQECTENGAGKAQMNQVTNLFVITRIREGVERKAVFTPAPLWIEDGKPPIGQDAYVFGITDLIIRTPDRADNTTKNRAVFQAEYTRWTTLPPESTGDPSASDAAHISSIGQVKAYTVVDHLELEKTRKGWKIVVLEEEDRRVLK